MTGRPEETGLAPEINGRVYALLGELYALGHPCVLSYVAKGRAQVITGTDDPVLLENFEHNLRYLRLPDERPADATFAAAPKSAPPEITVTNKFLRGDQNGGPIPRAHARPLVAHLNALNNLGYEAAVLVTGGGDGRGHMITARIPPRATFSLFAEMAAEMAVQPHPDTPHAHS